MFNGDNGWAISSAETYEDLERRDAVEASSLFDLLERHVVPLFYSRLQGPVPRQWVGRVKTSLRSLGPEVSASRMVRDYVETLYEPTAARADRLSASSGARARALAQWKARVRDGWDGVRVTSIDSDASAADLGTKRRVSVVIELKGLTADDVAVQLVHGVVGPNDELQDTTVTPMTLAGLADDHGHLRGLARARSRRPLRLHRPRRPPPRGPRHLGRARPHRLGLGFSLAATAIIAVAARQKRSAAFELRLLLLAERGDAGLRVLGVEHPDEVLDLEIQAGVQRRVEA